MSDHVVEIVAYTAALLIAAGANVAFLVNY